MNNQDMLKEWDKAKKFVLSLKKNNTALDFKQLCIDVLADKYTVEFFSYVIVWIWGWKVELNGLSENTHWAIWSCSETFTTDEENLIPPDWNDVNEFKARIELALEDKYQEIWRRLGLSEET